MLSRLLWALLALGLLAALAAPASARPRHHHRGWSASVAPEVSAARRTRHTRRRHKHRQTSVRQSRVIPEAVRGLVTAAAQAAGVPVAIAHAVIRTESRYNPRARGRAGEIGLSQLKLQTARGLGFRGSAAQLFDPATNLRFGMRYLRMALNRGGTGCAGVSLYQSGVYARPHCSNYGRRVLASTR